MYLDKAKKEEIFGQYGKSTTDTGSAEAQIALFSYRISHLTEHLKKNHKDHNTARSLTMLVGKRRKLLKYLYNKDIIAHREAFSCTNNPLPTGRGLFVDHYSMTIFTLSCLILVQLVKVASCLARMVMFFRLIPSIGISGRPLNSIARPAPLHTTSWMSI